MQKFLHAFEFKVRLECKCPYGQLRIFKTADTAPLLLDFSNGKTFRYFLRTLSYVGLSVFSLWKFPDYFQETGRLLSVRIRERTLIRIGPKKKNIDYAALLSHFVRFQFGL
jgi:hypothetical protein